MKMAYHVLMSFSHPKQFPDTIPRNNISCGRTTFTSRFLSSWDKFSLRIGGSGFDTSLGRLTTPTKRLSMQKLSVLYHTVSLWRGTSNGQNDTGMRYGATNILLMKRDTRATFPSTTKYSGLDLKFSHSSRNGQVRAVASGDLQEVSDEDDDVCPAECVREFKTDDEFLAVLEKAKKADSLVVVDFYRTACGSCKYIEQIFTKLCKGAGENDAKVVFLKHNVIDEYDEQSEVAERLRIKAVPLFHFYRNGALLEAFPTRDKERILAAISKYSPQTPNVQS